MNFNKIILWFTKEIHLSKVKVILAGAFLLYVFVSFTFEIDLIKKTGLFSRGNTSIDNVIVAAILIFMLIVIDFLHKSQERRHEIDKRKLNHDLIKDPNISDHLKEKLIDKN